MSGWITRDHVCEACSHIMIYLHVRAEEVATVACERCGCPAHMRLSATVMNAAWPDGNRRFAGIRERRAVQRELQVAKRQRRKDDVAKLNKELLK